MIPSDVTCERNAEIIIIHAQPPSMSSVFMTGVKNFQVRKAGRSSASKTILSDLCS